jgi:hypothetical protein
MKTFLLSLLIATAGWGTSDPETLPVASRMVFSSNESTVWISPVDQGGKVLVRYSAHREVNMELSNSLGQVCLRRRLEPSVSGSEATLSLQRMPEGYYQLRVCCGETASHTVLIR